jgi:phosphatidylglycerophosphate synthase
MTAKKPAEQARREHHSLLAEQEKRLLVWTARRLPERVNSDHLSLLGLSAMLAAGLAFWASSFNRWLLLGVVAALAVNWFGDSLDGTLARVRDQQRPRYGFYVDHVLDVVGAAFLFAGMAFSSHMSTALGLGLLVVYLMVSAESYLATHARSVFKLSFMRVGPTELRLLLAAGVLRVMVDPAVALFGRDYLLLDVGGAVAAAGMLVAFVVSAVRNTAALYRAEPMPPRPSASKHAPAMPRRRRTDSDSASPSLVAVRRPGEPQLAVSLADGTWACRLRPDARAARHER